MCFSPPPPPPRRVCPGGVQLAERTREAAGQRSELSRLQQRSAQLVEELAGQEDRSRQLATELSRLRSTSSHSQDEVRTQDTHTSHHTHVTHTLHTHHTHIISHTSHTHHTHITWNIPKPQLRFTAAPILAKIQESKSRDGSRSHLASNHPCSHVH